MKLDGHIGFIGTGNMAEALVRGLLAGGTVDASQVSGSEPRPERCAEIREKYGIHCTTDNSDVARRADVLVLSVKPQLMVRVCTEIAPVVRTETLVISIAAGVPLAVLSRYLPGRRIVRTMPNTPALVGAGATVLSPGDGVSEADLGIARRIFDAVGTTFVLEESQLDAVTGLSGSGPAYTFLILEALSDAGVKVGLSRYVAQALAAQTLLGSAKLLIDTKGHPGQLKDMVTSPGGTAIAGLHTLEEGGLRTTLINAVEAATKRSRELGELALAQLHKK